MSQCVLIEPVVVDSRVRAVTEISSVEPSAQGYRVGLRTTVELEGSSRPALVAETIGLFVPAYAQASPAIPEQGSRGSVSRLRDDPDPRRRGSRSSRTLRTCGEDRVALGGLPTRSAAVGEQPREHQRMHLGPLSDAWP